MPTKKSTTPKVKPARIEETFVETPFLNGVLAQKFPVQVMQQAEIKGKIPLHYWYEDDGKTLAIQWDDFSKDRYPVG